MNFLNNKTEFELLEFGKQNHEAYINAKPFPSDYYDNLFNPGMLREIIAEFPEIGKTKEDIQYENPNEQKLATKGEYRFGPKTKAFVHFLNLQPFLEFLQNLTGIREKLMPSFYEIRLNSYLKMHVDFLKHRFGNLYRRLNILVYLNEDWKDEYGGHLKLWEKDMSKCVTKILPQFNRLAMFSTTDFSWHGLPYPLTCPPDRSRRSIALYYYTNGRSEREINVGDKSRVKKIFDTRKGQDYTQITIFNPLVYSANHVLPPFSNIY
jgi:hypothetical protein